jgi:hypothetical protein
MFTRIQEKHDVQKPLNIQDALLNRLKFFPITRKSHAATGIDRVFTLQNRFSTCIFSARTILF